MGAEVKAVHQPTLLEGVAGVRTVSGAEAAGVEQPVARVAVDMSLPHLDRPIDYRVPPELDAAAQPGTRVSVRFAGKDRSGFVLERSATTDHHGTLTPIRRVVSDLPEIGRASCRERVSERDVDARERDERYADHG